MWKDESEPSPIKNFNSQTMFDLSNHQDDCETFTYVIKIAYNENIDLRLIYRWRRRHS